MSRYLETLGLPASYTQASADILHRTLAQVPCDEDVTRVVNCHFTPDESLPG
jgi:hypothetical protein